jgi:hypothetical protein
MMTPHTQTLKRALSSVILIAITFVFGLPVLVTRAVDWIRPGKESKELIWGLRGGLQFAIHPSGFTWKEGGPRGLIRIGYPTLPDGKYDLINFIAIEPLIGQMRGLSELEKSSIDGKQGKIFRTGNADRPADGGDLSADRGTVTVVENGVEELVVPIRVEKFDNGAHVRLILSQRSDRPDELKLTVRSELGSANLDSCILTATMGNKARTRTLWLKGESISSLTAFGDYRGNQFTPHLFVPLKRLARGSNGDVVVAISTDEKNPAEGNSGLSRGWQYRGEKVTQYWRKAAEEISPSLQCAVNARFTYWMSKNPIPGGLAYENFELVEKFRDGQSFTFGITKKSFEDLLKQSLFEPSPGLQPIGPR